ncbi:flagellar basal body P-ring protein FlgI [Hyphobacterium marinum]|uniref:Flagellar P-ring protein n=1 Tax=Hyphobacterium marinum TaxID=3116574 RepID=A0ABU7M0I3_9PROT|nr:flagellar basal body P-ring protein FlgI [Hyphobacterium sp. Y6023]MEE2567047.1 flagellar basal body P-ring protein FlgI [Hyphobacterium sp. Y6023]
MRARPYTFAILAALAGLLLLATPVEANSRIKDITDVEGVRENQLVGYGLVVGLDGSGDSLRNAAFTRQSLSAMLERFDVNTRDATLNTRNTAAVIITAHLPAFATQGSRADVTVSAIGDADSLQGGTLIATALIGADGQVYAVAQGQVAVGGFQAQGDAASVTRGVPTSGRIANGALIERELRFDLANRSAIRLALRNPDFTTATRTADSINAYLGTDAARAADPATVVLTRPDFYTGDMVALLSEIEQLRVEPDLPARVVIDEATGTIVMGENVRVSTVAIAQGNLTISVTESPIASQPNPFAREGETEVLPRTNVQVTEDAAQLGVLDTGVSLSDLVDGLNALGVSPRDMIAILQSIKAAGALQAEIEVL